MAALPEGLPSRQPAPDNGLGTSGRWDAAEFVSQHDQLVVQRADSIGTGARPPAPTYLDTPFARALPEPGRLITDLEELENTMGTLALTCNTAGLPHLRYGLEGYRAVTIAFTRQLGEFEDSSKMAGMIPVFFDELTKRFWHHATGHPAAVHGWYPHFYEYQARRSRPAVQMFDFMISHVEDDLPVSLLRTHTQERHKTDYTEKANDVLRGVAEGIIGRYMAFYSPLDKIGVDKFSLEYLLRELFASRDEAWKKFKELSVATSLEEYAEIRCGIKQRVRRRLLSSRRLAGLALRLSSRTPGGVWLDDKLALDETI